MKKFFFILSTMFVAVSQVLATTYVPVTREQAIKMGFTEEVKIQDEAEKLIGPQICFWHKTKDKIGFIMIFGSDSSKEIVTPCIKVVKSVFTAHSDTFRK